MGLRRLVFNLSILILLVVSKVSANGVFRVHHIFAGQERSLSDVREHDGRRLRRFMYGVDLPLGGNGHPADTGLYFTKLGIGSPSKDYYVQVDTGNDMFWVNCIECSECPRKSSLGIELTLYDPNDSDTGKVVACDQDFCSAISAGPLSGCNFTSYCPYTVVYGDGSSTTGYYVKDVVQYDRVSGNLQTSRANGSVYFGCGAQQSGDLGSPNAALDGVLGFGQSNLSMLSQLASSGKVKKMFAHCLGGADGGGMFAIGRVVQPKVKTTPLVANQSHYNVNMKAIEVGSAVLQLPIDVFETGDRKGTIIDTGTTFAYLSEVVYGPLINEILSQHSNLTSEDRNLTLHTSEDQFSCFHYTESVDDGFPNVTFYFENSLPLVVHPHDYLFQLHGDVWCIGWQDSGKQYKEGKYMNLLGDFVLSNKLVLYDLENQTIGWTEFNCSSSIKLQDEQSGASYLVVAHDLSSAWSLDIGRIIILLLLTAMLHIVIY